MVNAKKILVSLMLGMLYNASVSATEWSEYTFILKPSTIPGAGVGIFATHDIQAGSYLSKKNNSDDKIGDRKVKMKDVPSEFVKFCVYLNDHEGMIPERFDRLAIWSYLNHSFNPNIALLPNSADYYFYALRDIKAGEEIYMDYNELDEPEHLKDAYYKRS